MSTVHKLAGGLMLVTKGATDVLLDRCVVSPEERARIEQVNEQFSQSGCSASSFTVHVYTCDGKGVSCVDNFDCSASGLSFALR